MKPWVIFAIAAISAFAWFTSVEFLYEESRTGEQAITDITDDKLRVYASFYPYYEFTKNVGGEYAIVKQYLPLGIEVHDWEPRASEILQLSNTDVFVYNGLGIEPYVDKVIMSGDFDNVVFVKATTGVKLIEIEENMRDHNGIDPHVWLDPILVQQQVNNIRDGLSAADPENAENYAKNAIAYNKKLSILDAKITSSLANCGQDTIVPFHDAFAYFGERYQIRVNPLSGQAPDSEASAAEIAKFITFIQENDINVIFTEDLIDPRLAESIAAETGAKTLILSPIEAVSVGNNKNNVSYLDKMEQNLAALVVAMECLDIEPIASTLEGTVEIGALKLER